MADRIKARIIIAALCVLALLILADQYFQSSEYTRVLDNTERKKISVSPDLLAQYVGVYQLKPGFDVTVTQQGERLFAQATNQVRVEFYPASETLFFNDITPLLMQFERSASGNVDRFRALEPGRNRVATRLQPDFTLE